MKSFVVRDHNGRSFLTHGQYVLDVNRISTVTLDLDDTLWAIGPVIARAEQRLRNWLSEHYPGVTEQLSHDDVIELRNRVFVEHADKTHDMTFLRREIITRMGRAAGYEIDVDVAFEVFDAARNDLELYPDVRPALVSLARRFTLIAVTNGNANLEKIGISELFDGCVSARSVGAAKPAARIFEAAVKAGGADKSQTLHVGDHPRMDIHGARAAGLRAVWINRKGFDWPDDVAWPDSVVSDLHGLDDLLGQR